MTDNLECPKCKEPRGIGFFKNDKTGKKSYWCAFCVSDMQVQNKHRKERFKRNPSPCDSRLADKELKKEIREIWEME